MLKYKLNIWDTAYVKYINFKLLMNQVNAKSTLIILIEYK